MCAAGLVIYNARPINLREILVKANPGCRAAAVMILTLAVVWANGAAAAEKLHFAVGPFQPTATDTKKAY
jgi:hypothetical protein